MAGNIENLERSRAATQFNGETAVEAGRKGAIKSAESKRRRKAFRDLLKDILPREVDDEEMRRILEDAGLDPTHENAICLAAIKRASRGDVEAMRFVRDTMGEKPMTGIGVSAIPYADAPVSEWDMSKLSDDELRSMLAEASGI